MADSSVIIIPLVYGLAAAAGYLLGSFPTGYLAGRQRGIDIRQHGSGNIGATNVVRVLGKPLGLLVFVCDGLKGLLAVWTGGLIEWGADAGWAGVSASPLPHVFAHLGVRGGIVAALACILGHNFPVWLRFRGGKGISTTFGVLLGLMPLSLAVAAGTWFAAFYATRYVSVASMLAAVTLPVTITLLWRAGRADPALLWFSVAAALLAIWQHRSNLRRLRAGTEPRAGSAPASPHLKKGT